MHYVYTLDSSLEIRVVRYVGITNDLRRRLNKHKHSYTATWILGVYQRGGEIIMNHIDTCETLYGANIKEVYYIKKYKESGNKLTNLTVGGDGSLGYSHTTETKKKISEHNGLGNLGNRKYGIDLDTKVKVLFEQGLNSGEISRKLNVPKYAIKSARVRQNLFYNINNNIFKKCNKLDITREELYTLYVVEDKSRPQIAVLKNCSPRTIKKYLSLYHIKKQYV